MKFFSSVTYNDRMSPLDFDLFRKIHILMGVTPDFFEVVLMVSPHSSLSPFVLFIQVYRLTRTRKYSLTPLNTW
jgi:Chitin synthase